jgi:hypothetical protein
MAPPHRLAIELSGQDTWRTIATNGLSYIEDMYSKSQNYREAV